ncbi:hemin ABC transporter ATP-binding protein [Verrucomicrobia bacterium LW23]|nr:hemin ABC transporter ATP-binding protein [Verrucomicrobia bacterium LW23]
MKTTFVETQNLVKKFGTAPNEHTVLQGISAQFYAAEATLLLGPSGSGKTTFLSILGCLLSPSSGKVILGDREVDFANKQELTEIRREALGFIFQQSQLLPFLTVRDNLFYSVPARQSAAARRQRAQDLMESLGIDQVGHLYPGQLSGGQRQRASIARAVFGSPHVIFADEPTAALDWENATRVMEMLISRVREEGTTLLMVAHDTRLIPYFDRVVHLEGGQITGQHTS